MSEKRAQKGTQTHPGGAGRPIPHEHHFKTTMHVDMCHSWSTTGACECGAAIVVGAERNIQDDPYSAIWMDQETQGEKCEPCLGTGVYAAKRCEACDGEGYVMEECARCKELLAGATPKPFHQEIIESPEAK